MKTEDRKEKKFAFQKHTTLIWTVHIFPYKYIRWPCYSPEENPAILKIYNLVENRTFHWYMQQDYISMREKGRVMVMNIENFTKPLY